MSSKITNQMAPKGKSTIEKSKNAPKGGGKQAKAKSFPPMSKK
jgi:hypothetical protein